MHEEDPRFGFFQGPGPARPAAEVRETLLQFLVAAGEQFGTHASGQIVTRHRTVLSPLPCAVTLVLEIVCREDA